jgi:parallel beta-helix repeat protein
MEPTASNSLEVPFMNCRIMPIFTYRMRVLTESSPVPILFAARLCALMILAVLLCPAATYYVDSAGGNDGSSGRSAFQPWKTLRKVSKTKLAAGDLVRLRCGGVWRETLDVNGSGTTGKPIIVESYGEGEPPLIEGAVKIREWTETSQGGRRLIAYRVSGWKPWGVWDGENGYAQLKTQAELGRTDAAYYYDKGASQLYVSPSAAVDPNKLLINRLGNGILIRSREHVIIRRIEVRHTISGIFVRNSDHVTIEECGLHYNSYAGVEANRASHGVIRDSNMRGNGQAKGGQAITVNGITKAVNWVIERNEVLDNGGNSFYRSEDWSWGGGIALAHGAADSVVRHNFVRCDPDLKLPSDIGIDLESGAPRNNDVHYNIVSGCKYGIMLSSGVENRIYNNTVLDVPDALSKNNGAAGIAIHHKSTGNSVKNNLITTSTPLKLGSPSVAISVAKDSRQGSDIDYNLYYLPNAEERVGRWGSGYASFEKWKQASGADRHGVYAPPEFLMEGERGVFVSADSPAAGAGVNVGLPKDHFGRDVPAEGPVTIGAVQADAPGNRISGDRTGRGGSSR